MESRRRYDAGLRRKTGAVSCAGDIPPINKKRERYAVLIGVDEAGRGPLAGPVVAAAVVLPPHTRGLCSLRDSKKLSPKSREVLYQAIRSQARAVSVAWSHPRRIDEKNILAESLAAMGRAVIRARKSLDRGEVVSPGPCLAAVDGNRRIPRLTMDQIPIVGGDDLSLSIAAASVVAKVVRDRWMARLDRLHPGYGLARHKGYGTRAHIAALRERGPSPTHRKTFSPVSELLLKAVA